MIWIDVFDESIFLQKQIGNAQGNEQCQSTLLSAEALSQTVFQSLLTMMQGVEYENYRLEQSTKFIRECADSANCSVQTLCEDYRLTFNCNKEGHLAWINMRNHKLRGELKLSAIPQTVKIITLAQNHLSSIGNLSDLRGSSLMTLNINRNPTLKLDIRVFQDHRDPLPLENLRLSLKQICVYLGVEGMKPDARNLKISEWVQTSTLKELWINTGYNVVKLFKDGHFEQEGDSRSESIETRSLRSVSRRNSVSIALQTDGAKSTGEVTVIYEHTGIWADMPTLVEEDVLSKVDAVQRV